MYYVTVSLQRHWRHESLWNMQPAHKSHILLSIFSQAPAFCFLPTRHINIEISMKLFFVLVALLAAVSVESIVISDSNHANITAIEPANCQYTLTLKTAHVRCLLLNSSGTECHDSLRYVAIGCLH